jgi:hypothetical protein
MLLQINFFTPIYDIIFVTSRMPAVLLRENSTNAYMLSMFSAVFLSCLVTELQKPSSPGLEPRTVFGAVAFVFVIYSSKQTTLVLAPFFYRVSFPSYKNHLHWDSNRGAILTDVFVIFFPEIERWNRQRQSPAISSPTRHSRQFSYLLRQKRD